MGRLETSNDGGEPTATEPTPRFWEVFFEVYEALPRQGPGARASTARALAMCDQLPATPSIVDLGCGVGRQTLDLADLTDGTIVAVDDHAPFIDRLGAAVTERDLAERIRPLLADMASTGLPPSSLDLVWSEGALYQLGLDAALRVCSDLLRPGGYLAFTDAVWRRDDVPAEVRAAFDFDYPSMADVAHDIAAISASGLELIGHFTLPHEAWWDDFYRPMQARIRELRSIHAHDDEALSVLDRIDAEIEMHHRHGHCYGYEFFVARSAPIP